ncbi:MAG TPA: molybdopterin-binding protein [Candidatus Limnocylindria bacterium]|nr:molybdopterin-binding protein [Candidatus Limnocylindria bacterium]
MSSVPRVILLSIGSELLAGETVDTNAAFVAHQLGALGLAAVGARQLPDDRAVLSAAFAEAMADADALLVTGGLGPTHDDVTREGLADALGETLAPDEELEAGLRERFSVLGRMPETNLRQALRIPSAEPLPNPIGSAPGWWIARERTVVALMPGVPSEMRRMFTEQVAPRLASRFGRRPVAVRVVKTFGVGESAVAERVAPLLERPGEGITAGIYARDDGVHLRFATAGTNADLDHDVAQADVALGKDVWGHDADDLAAIVLAALGRTGVRSIASWEADTGGALLSLLAAVPAVDGAARYAGGVLDSGAAPQAPLADACLQLSLLPQDAQGRSRVRVAVSGAVKLPQRELRIHGSGDQRRRRAAFAALDAVRRELAGPSGAGQ